MATMTKFARLADARAAAAEDVRLAYSEGRGPSTVYILRRDGDSEAVSCICGRVTRRRVVGHRTCGLEINHDDLPCVVGH